MMRRRRTPLITCAAAALTVLGVSGYLFLREPDLTVDTIRLDGFTSAPTLRSPVGDGTSRPVDGLEQLTGELRSGDGPEDWYVGGVGVDFGPRAWLLTDPVLEDFDGDGTAAALLVELRALEGTEVTLGVRHDPDEDPERDAAGVFTVNGLTFRDTDGGPAPWEDTGSSYEADQEEAASAAEEAVGEGAEATGVDRVDEDGWQGWEVRVRGGDGQEYHVILDLSGAVADVRPNY
ncbi:hypothetical protein NE857_12705 [Nocardiopsis exhalans]|uniref:PepSY domain-containing protein n=1 Tax=Nocardiopsis exhalans TaxID=163604 RepID=A0ABY5DGU2_9ACTN|nr:hypothetical protein [Nocardiopsis exhalans]USY22388.1 hypothetical protein NE857_12705 [Nocardiopsis exhalans]